MIGSFVLFHRLRLEATFFAFYCFISDMMYKMRRTYRFLGFRANPSKVNHVSRVREHKNKLVKLSSDIHAVILLCSMKTLFLSRKCRLLAFLPERLISQGVFASTWGSKPMDLKHKGKAHSFFVGQLN